MKRLYVLRHAKAVQINKHGDEDHERPLTDKGVREAKLVGEYLKSNNAKIDIVVSSTSQRTKETTKYALDIFKKNPLIEYEKKLYNAGTNDILKVVRNLDDSYSSAMIVGHNPGLHQFAYSLVKDAKNENQSRELSANYPPGSLAVIDFDVDLWEQIDWRSGTLEDFLITKQSAEV